MGCAAPLLWTVLRRQERGEEGQGGREENGGEGRRGREKERRMGEREGGALGKRKEMVRGGGTLGGREGGGGGDSPDLNTFDLSKHKLSPSWRQ